MLDTYIQSFDLNLVYSYGWEAEQGGARITTPDAIEYEELYNTALWDKILLVSLSVMLQH